ncbi:cyclin-dependent kinase F-1 [Trifolium repens]|nr:cyclin-dependent kinase F-1 [Trifolium repens]
MDPPATSWSIHTRPEITTKYEILNHIGSGSYADVYRGRRLSDGTTVALKEVHDHQSASREIDALKILRGSENVVFMHEFFWREDEDGVIVLEFLRTDLAAVIRGAGSEKIDGGEVKGLMMQMVSGVHACHQNRIVHRDLKPENFLISDDGVVKLADFGQARILMASRFDASNHESSSQHPHDIIPLLDNSNQTEFENQEEEEKMSHDEYFRVLDDLKIKSHTYDTDDKDTNTHEGNNSCLATCTTSDDDDDAWKNSLPYEGDEDGGNEEHGFLTSCVGTRWFRAPELLYGSTNYGLEVDIWSLGCVFAELLTLKPLFPGTGDIDQISRIISVLGELDEEAWNGCSKLPDYGTISFTKVENPIGLEACLPNCLHDEVSLVKKLVCYNPARRVTAMELLHDKYFSEEPLPVSVSQLRVPPIA